MTLAHISEPTFTFKLGPLLIATFDGKNNPRGSAEEFASCHQTTLANLITPPGKADDGGFQQIVTDPRSFRTRFDGIHITKQQSVGMSSRDCPIVTIVDVEKMEWVVCHAGRPAISPLPFSTGRYNHGIINNAVGLLLGRGSLPHHLHAYITAGICKKCFVHHPTRDAHLLKPFFPEYRWAFDTKTGWLDLKRIIHSQLTNMRVSAKNIHLDGLCTKEHPGLASNRGGNGPDQSNLVTVFAQP